MLNKLNKFLKKNNKRLEDMLFAMRIMSPNDMNYFPQEVAQKCDDAKKLSNENVSISAYANVSHGPRRYSIGLESADKKSKIDYCFENDKTEVSFRHEGSVDITVRLDNTETVMVNNELVKEGPIRETAIFKAKEKEKELVELAKISDLLSREVSLIEPKENYLDELINSKSVTKKSVLLDFSDRGYSPLEKQKCRELKSFENKYVAISLSNNGYGHSVSLKYVDEDKRMTWQYRIQDKPVTPGEKTREDELFEYHDKHLDVSRNSELLEMGVEKPDAKLDELIAVKKKELFAACGDGIEDVIYKKKTDVNILDDIDNIWGLWSLFLFFKPCYVGVYVFSKPAKEI